MRSDIEQADDSYGASTWRDYALMLAERLRAAELELVDLRSGTPTRSTVARPANAGSVPEIDLRDEAPDPDAESFGPGPDAEFWSESRRGAAVKTGLRARFARPAKASAQLSTQIDAESPSTP